MSPEGEYQCEVDQKATVEQAVKDSIQDLVGALTADSSSAGDKNTRVLALVQTLQGCGLDSKALAEYKVTMQRSGGGEEEVPLANLMESYLTKKYHTTAFAPDGQEIVDPSQEVTGESADNKTSWADPHQIEQAKAFDSGKIEQAIAAREQSSAVQGFTEDRALLQVIKSQAAHS